MPMVKDINVPVMYYCNVIAEKFEWGNYVPLDLFNKGSECEREFPYEQMIRNYNKLNDNNKEYSEAAINEMFIWDEVVQLYELFASSNDALHYVKVKLPIKPVRSVFCNDLPTAASRGGGDLLVKEGMLTFRVGYNVDMTLYDSSNGCYSSKVRELYFASRNEYLTGNGPKEDFWDDPKFE